MANLKEFSDQLVTLSARANGRVLTPDQFAAVVLILGITDQQLDFYLDGLQMQSVIAGEPTLSNNVLNMMDISLHKILNEPK